MRKTAYLLTITVLMLIALSPVFAVPCPTRVCGMGIDVAPSLS